MIYRQIIDSAQKSSAQRVVILTAIMLIFTNIGIFASYSNKWVSISPAIDRACDGLERAMSTDSLGTPRASALLTQLQAAVKASPSDEAAMLEAYWRTEFGIHNDIDGHALRRILESAGRPDSITRPYEWFRMNFLKLRLLLYYEKDYPEAYRLSEAMLPRLKSADYNGEEAMVLAAQGLLFYMIDNHNEAMRRQVMARERFTGSGRQADSLRNELNYCNTLAKLGKVTDTVKRLKMLEMSPVVRTDRKLHCNILMSLFHFTHENAYAREAHREASLTDNEVLKMKTLQNLSEIFYNEGDTASALDIQRQVYNFFRMRKDPDLIVPLRGIVEIFEATHRNDSAIVYMHRLVAAQDSFSHVENMALISRMKAQNDISNLKINMSLAETRAALERRKSLIIFILCTGMILLGLMAWAYYRRKVMSEKKLRESENERLSVNLQNERLQNEQFQNAIDSQGRELTSKALLVLNKNRMLSELLDKIHEFAEAGTLPRPQAKILEKKIKEHLNSDHDWDDFTRHFEQMNPQFFQTLKERYPILTDKDLKLCAYIKLGFSGKQIAQMLSVLPESVNTTRYRLRRKMQLPPETSLEDLLRGI